MEIQYAGLIGLYGGMFAGLLGWFLSRKKLKEQRGLDELFFHLRTKSRTYSWFITLFSLYGLFTLYLVGVPISVPVALGIMLFMQLGSWAIASVVLQMHVSMHRTLSKMTYIGISIMVFSILLFTVIAWITSNWIFLFWPIPFCILGYQFLRHAKREKEGVV